MRRLVIAAVTLGLLAVGIVPAAGHGTFIDARPLPGVDVGGTVNEVAFLFPEPLLAGQGEIVLFDPVGAAVPARGGLEHPAESVVRIPIGPLEDPGRYRVTWRLPAVDGFVFEGAFEFRYDPDAAPLDPLPYGREGRAPWLIGLAAVALGGFIAVARRRNSTSGR